MLAVIPPLRYRCRAFLKRRSGRSVRREESKYKGIRAALAGSMGLVALIAGGAACHADALESRLMGAWAASAADCARLFEPRGGTPAFRQPVDKFAQAAIIAPQEIVTPSNTCRVQKVSHQGGAIKVTANCNDTIGYSTDTAEIRFGSGGEIIYSATGDPSLATTLIKCRL
jgi:hypothetical protein